jgi:hypothetical protein
VNPSAVASGSRVQSTMRTPPTILIARSRIRELLPIKDCIAAVEAAFAAASRGKTTLAGVLGSHVANGGFHVKTAGLQSDTAYFAAKINANFPMNPSRSGRPTIQGVLVLYDATNGDPLAVMDSGEITRIRTAAATAVANPPRSSRHSARSGRSSASSPTISTRRGRGRLPRTRPTDCTSMFAQYRRSRRDRLGARSW